MVRGIDTFKKFFAGFEGNYVIIGGTACEVHEEIYAQNPRATKDIDIILIVEALSSAFIIRFWDFVKAGGYVQRNKGTDSEHRHEYYRFKNPEDIKFPYQIELFSRRLGLVNFPADAHITPIPVDEDLSSLSAILMDDCYYDFTINHSTMEEGIHIANIESLICLKCKAYLEMLERKRNGGQIDNKHIIKHRKDVFRLTAMLTPANVYDIPEMLKADIIEFCNKVKENLPNTDFFKSAGLENITGEQLLQQLKNSFIVQA